MSAIDDEHIRHTTTVRIPLEMREAFKALVKEEGRTVSADVRRYMRDRLREAEAAKQRDQERDR
jgi:predicted DNA-binding protein